MDRRLDGRSYERARDLPSEAQLNEPIVIDCDDSEELARA